MTLTLAFAWWNLPALITLLGLAWVFGYVLPRDGGWFAGLGTLIALVPVLFISAVAWAIAGALK